jgi:hypothetical protein
LNGRVALLVPAQARLDQSGDAEATDNDSYQMLVPDYFTTANDKKLQNEDRRGCLQMSEGLAEGRLFAGVSSSLLVCGVPYCIEGVPLSVNK